MDLAKKRGLALMGARVMPLVFALGLSKLIYSQDVISPISIAVSYTHLRAHETLMNLVCRLLLEKTARALVEGYGHRLPGRLRCEPRSG